MLRATLEVCRYGRSKHADPPADTITIPTDAQILYALRASRGDDVYREDPTTNALEERVARLSGKEAALFCSSTTMSNQLAIRSTLTQPPHSIICDHRAHTYMWEAGGAALFSQATSHALTPSNGLHLTADDIERNLCLGNDIHFAPNRMISLENTMSGVVFPQEEILKIHSLAKKHDLALHLDGARAWNVAARELERRGLDASKDTDIQAVLSELLEPFDTVGLCLSKGLGAPIGSILVGTKSLIDRARWFRKMFGGGWRQSGLLAAQADWAITHHMPRLAGTHKLAARLAEGLEDAGCEILAPVHTNMVYFDPSPLGLSTDTVMAALAALPDPIVLQDNRCVIHHQTSPKAVEDLVAEVHRLGHEAPQSERGKAKQAKLGY